MDTKQFKDTFSAVRAPDALRLEVFKMTESKHKSTGRILPKLLLAAAILSLLTTSVFAASAIYDALKGGKAEFIGGNYYAVTGAPNDDIPMDRYTLYLDVKINPDAPKTIETYYMPVLDEGYIPFFGDDLKQKMTQFGWSKGLRNWEDTVYFYQEPGGSFDPNRPKASIFVPSGTEIQAEHVTLGEISGYLAEDPFAGDRRFYWSDGNYVFTLWVPDEYSDEQLAALAASVRQVPSIDPYLVDKETHYQIIYGDHG